MWYWRDMRSRRTIHHVGMMVCRGEGIALLSESELRIAKTQRSYWRRPAWIPLRAWPAWRDKHLGKLLDKFNYYPIWQAPDGEHRIRVATVRKMGDELIILLPNREERWIRGCPPPGSIHTIDHISWYWDQKVDFERRETFLKLLEYPLWQESVFFTLSYNRKWEELQGLLEQRIAAEGKGQRALDYLRKLLS